MKLTLVVSYYPPEVGSAAHLFQELAKALAERGHDVTIVTARPRSYNVAGESLGRPAYRFTRNRRREGRVRVIRLAVPTAEQDSPFSRAVEHFLIGIVFGLHLLLSPGVDRYLVYSPPLPLAFAACIVAKVRGIPILVNVQDLYPQTAVDLGLLRGRLPVRFFEWMEHQTYRLASFLTAHSGHNREHIIAKGAPRERVSVVYNWVDTRALHPMPKENAFRSDNGLDGKFVVTYAGIMSYPQDLESVVKAAWLLKDNPDIAFLIVGDGPRKREVEEFVRQHQLSNVKLLPLQPKETYAKVLAASDTCLVTLKSNVKTPVVPSKLQSILAAGRVPIVSVPPTSDARRIIETFGCGRYVSAENPDMLAQTIEELRGEKDALPAVEARCRHIAERLFSLETAVTRIEELMLAYDNQDLDLNRGENEYVELIH